MKKVIDLLPNRKEYCLLVKSAFSSEFCEKIILEKKNSFKQAKTHYPTSYRNNERQVVNNKNLSLELFQEIKNYIPNKIEITGISKEEFGKWQLDSLNSRIRICRYLPNQYFNKHLDGVYFASENKQSKLTFMIYLNGFEDFDGGRTLFFNSKTDDTIIGSYKPEKGDLIIFDHNLWHSGETVLAGEKYILRSDIIYRKVGDRKKHERKFCGEGHLGYIWTVTMFNERLITSGRDKKIKIWSKDGNKVSELLGHKNSVLSLIAFDNEIFISASRDMTVKIWKEIRKNKFQLTNSLNYHKGTVLCLCKINDKEFFSGGADGLLNQIAIDGRLINQVKAHHEWIWDIKKISTDYYTTISEDGSIKIWSFKKNEAVAIWKENIPINSIAINEQFILIGRFDGTIVQLEFDKKNKELKVFDKKKCHDGIIRRIIIDNKFVYTASEDSTLKIWNKENLEFVQSFKSQNFVQDIVLYDESIITVSYDGEILKREKPVNLFKS